MNLMRGNCSTDVHSKFDDSLTGDVCCGGYSEADCIVVGDNDGGCLKFVACRRSLVK